MHRHTAVGVSRGLLDSDSIQVVCRCGATAVYSEKWQAIVRGAGDWSYAEQQVRSGEMQPT